VIQQPALLLPAHRQGALGLSRDISIAADWSLDPAHGMLRDSSVEV